MSQAVEKVLLDLVRSGCQGTAKDYSAWAAFELGNTIDVNPTLVALMQSGAVKKHPEIDSELISGQDLTLPVSIAYKVSGHLKDSPIQLVRSRLEAFLRHHNASEDFTMDISIATTEAMENAVKYSDHSPIEISYKIDGGVFHIEIRNRLSEVRLEKDIEAGKYTSTTTLMRGMMVMVKLFDEMNIDILDEEKIAVFKAHRKMG